MTQTLSDVSSANVANRVSTGNQSFRMTHAPSPMMRPFQPRGTRLPKEAPANT